MSRVFPKSNMNTERKAKQDDIKRKILMTHSVEHRRADGFHDEAVIQTQFLQVLIEVV